VRAPVRLLQGAVHMRDGDDALTENRVRSAVTTRARP
jgi:hypothetical protein